METAANIKTKTQEILSTLFTTVEDAIKPYIKKSDSTNFTYDIDDIGDISKTIQNHALLLISVNGNDSELTKIYMEHIKKHNTKIASDEFPNSGFDLFIPNEITMAATIDARMIDLGIKCEMLYQDMNIKKSTTCGYYIYPRSSMSKTPLMLANHTGIIDSGYRGSLIGAFRNLGNEYVIEKNARLLQVCHPSLCPIIVKLVDESELSTTCRGEGGFGSTGLAGVVL